MRLGQFDEAAEWAVKAATRPNAHEHIFAIAAYSLTLAGKPDEASAFVTAIHKRHPGYSVKDFLNAFRFDAGGAALFRDAAKRLAKA